MGAGAKALLQRMLRKAHDERPSIDVVKRDAWVTNAEVALSPLPTLTRVETSTIVPTAGEVAGAITRVDLSVAVRLLVRSKSWAASARKMTVSQRNLKLPRVSEADADGVRSLKDVAAALSLKTAPPLPPPASAAAAGASTGAAACCADAPVREDDAASASPATAAPAPSTPRRPLSTPTPTTGGVSPALVDLLHRHARANDANAVSYGKHVSMPVRQLRATRLVDKNGCLVHSSKEGGLTTVTAAAEEHVLKAAQGDLHDMSTSMDYAGEVRNYISEEH